MPNRTIAVVQSSYIPWRGYFDLINRVDEFVILDTVQFTRRDWRSRNRVKTANGVQWLTIPVAVKNKYHQKIRDVRIADDDWARRHWQTLRHGYGRAPGFEVFGDEVAEWYRQAGGLRRLSEINHLFLASIARTLGIHTRLSWSDDYPEHEDASERLLGICRAAGATRYLSGPAARDYLDDATFRDAGVAVEYMSYSGYPEYPQLGGEFDHHVTILDLLFNVGADAPAHVRSLAAP